MVLECLKGEGELWRMGMWSVSVRLGMGLCIRGRW